ncbi:MAG: spermidine synthase, partial [Gammaproteobacteria bacterium]|nr:spermidine synthase [Gammaproteobacteria bacterium]
MRWSIAAALILPQSILLGTTFPLIGTAIVRMDQQHASSTLGMLYFTNSIGTAIGVLVSVFYLIGLLGLPGAIFTAGLINIFIAFVIWSYCRLGSILATTEAISPATTHSSIQFDARWLAGIALLTGLASFFYEIAWIRMLSLVLGSSMQAFELMLSAFITGLAFGGLWIRNRIEKIDNPILFLGRVQIIMGLCAVATLPLYNQMFDFMSFLMESLSKNEGGYLLFNLGSHFIALLIMLPATFMAGMTLPLITFTLLKMNQGEASIGRVYAFNTIGAIIGIILAVHIAMPLIGTKGLIICGGLVDLGLGIFLITRFVDKTRSSSRLALEYALPVAFLLVVSFGTQFDTIALSSGVFRYGGTTFSGPAEVLYYQNGKTASISVVEIADGTLSLATNGKADAAIY